jgi:hypothetical protein
VVPESDALSARVTVVAAKATPHNRDCVEGGEYQMSEQVKPLTTPEQRAQLREMGAELAYEPGDVQLEQWEYCGLLITMNDKGTIQVSVADAGTEVGMDDLVEIAAVLQPPTSETQSQLKPLSVEKMRQVLGDLPAALQIIVHGVIAAIPKTAAMLPTLKQVCTEKGIECAIVPPYEDLPGYLICRGIKEETANE